MGGMTVEQEMLAALRACQKMIDHALPKFNWGASALDANAIQLLNETPGKVSAAIARAETEHRTLGKYSRAK